MAIFGQIFNPLGPLQDTIEPEVGAHALLRIEEANARRPLMPLVGLGLAATGLLLIVAITISAGAHADNFAGAPGSVLDAVQFRPWFRISLLAGLGVVLIGILTILLSIMVRIWWLTYVNRTLLPAIVDAVREREGKRPIFLAESGDDERSG